MVWAAFKKSSDQMKTFLVILMERNHSVSIALAQSQHFVSF
jgi:hypothetical protein